MPAQGKRYTTGFRRRTMPSMLWSASSGCSRCASASVRPASRTTEESGRLKAGFLAASSNECHCDSHRPRFPAGGGWLARYIASDGLTTRRHEICNAGCAGCRLRPLLLELKRRHPEGLAQAGGPPEEEIQDGLAQGQGDEAFDAVVGLVGMLQVSLDQRAPRSGRATE